MKNLREIRKAKGFTQAQLAEAVGCNQGTLSKIEKGGNYTYTLAERIARRLGVSPVELFGVGELEHRYLTALRNAPEARRRAVLLLLEGDDEPPQDQ
jgi:transcriptional regulator with XRE-family HTH domain